MKRIVPAVIRASRPLLAVSFAVLICPDLYAQTNTTFAAAAALAVGHSALSRIGPGSTQYWFIVATVQGRSYCAETAHQDGVTGPTDFRPDTILDVYAMDGTTLVVANDDANEEPSQGNYSRACWIQTVPPSTVNAVRLRPFNLTLPAAQSVNLRLVETTLFCPWFFIAGDYNAFSLIRNTSFTSLSGVVVTWRGLDGAVAGTATVAIPGNGGVVLNARDFVNPGVFSNGTIEIAHRGALDQLQGSTTTLSGTTGLGFDAQFTSRRPW